MNVCICIIVQATMCMFVIMCINVCATMFVTVYVCMSLCVCCAQVKNVYVQFLMHAYIDTDVEMKEVYSRDTMWELFENFLPDISTVSNPMTLTCISKSDFLNFLNR